MFRTLLIRAVLRAFSLVPLPLAHGAGAALGYLAAAHGPLRRVTEANLALCLPDLDPAERKRLVLGSLVETGKAVAELGALWYWSRERLLQRVTDVQGGEHLQAAVVPGRGVIVAAPHLGAWELTGLYCATRHPVTALYRPPRVRELEGLIRGARLRFGGRLATTDARGVRVLYQALRRGEVVFVLPDQEPGKGSGVFAPFFGVPAYTMVLVSRLAARTGAPVLFAFAERLPRGAGYRLHFRPAPDGIQEKDTAVSAAALNRGVEECVRRLPRQYLWSYKRFRTRPPGEPPVY